MTDLASAYFQRAEAEHRENQAIADWRRYLRVDPAGSWTSEARNRLADAEQSKKTAK
jgi:hypothetical protein